MGNRGVVRQVESIHIPEGFIVARETAISHPLDSGSQRPDVTVSIPGVIINVWTKYLGMLAIGDCAPQEVRRNGAVIPRDFG